jgi:hypothetical protein
VLPDAALVQVQRTVQSKILRSAEEEGARGGMEEALVELTAALEREDEATLRRVLFEFISGQAETAATATPPPVFVGSPPAPRP